MNQFIARMHGDTVIETRGSTGPDGLHLTGLANRRVAGVFEIAAERSKPVTRTDDKTK